MRRRFDGAIHAIVLSGEFRRASSSRLFIDDAIAFADASSDFILLGASGRDA